MCTVYFTFSLLFIENPLIFSDCLIPFLFSEELKLQRNLENYALLSKGGAQARSSQQQSQQNFNDRRDFTITKVHK